MTPEQRKAARDLERYGLAFPAALTEDDVMALLLRDATVAAAFSIRPPDDWLDAVAAEGVRRATAIVDHWADWTRWTARRGLAHQQPDEFGMAPDRERTRLIVLAALADAMPDMTPEERSQMRTLATDGG